MKIHVFCLSMVVFVFGIQGAPSNEGEVEVAEFILTLKLYRSTNEKLVKTWSVDEAFLRLGVDEKVALLESDESVEITANVLRMVYGRCEFDSLTTLQYAEKKGGRFHLVESTCKHGLQVNLRYGLSETSKSNLVLHGKCEVWQSCGREGFPEFPALDAGKPTGSYSMGFEAGPSGRPFEIGGLTLVTQYGRQSIGEFVMGTLLIEEASSWSGELSEILNDMNTWIITDPSGGFIDPELIITR